MNHTAQISVQADTVRSRRIAIVLAMVAVGFYVGTFFFWTPPA